MNLTYGSVCSGIEAASVAWEPLGMRPEWFSEIESFPSAVLATHWPDVPNLGDMTKIASAITANKVTAPDLLVGGTPCQAFSFAGKREGLADERGQLTLAYVELVNAIDTKRAEQGREPVISCWENVPGVLSSKDNAFGYFLAGLAGENEPFEPGDRPAKGKSGKYWRWDKATSNHIPKWPKSGFLIGRQRRLAWRILDAQYFGVAQRRRRVFVVATARTDINPSKILLECEGVRRDIAPSRGEGKAVAAATGGCVKVGSHWDNPANPHPTLNQSHNTGKIGQSNQELFSQCGSGIIAMAHGQAGAEIKTDNSAPTLTCNHEAPIAVYGIPGNWIGRSPENGGNATEPMHNVAPCLTVADRHGVAYCLQHAQVGRKASAGPQGKGWQEEVGYTLDSRASADVVAFGFKAGQGAKAGGIGYAEEQSPTLTSASSGTNLAPTVMLGMSVRRLTPIECERLQGFPDNHTLIPYGKTVRPEKMEADYAKYLMRDGRMTFEECCRAAADGHRYKAIGNSMAVPVMRWIGERLLKGLSNTAAPAARTKPFLKWAGGKFSVIDDVLAQLPRGRRLIEPFAGGGSIFLNAGFDEVIANDTCDDLILTYQVMQCEPLALTDKAYAMFQEGNNPDYFDKLKARFNKREIMTQLERAAAFIYLNRHCYNGLMRYNRLGEFNVGFGKYRQPYFPRAELEAFAAVARRCTFAVADCNDTVALAGEGDVIFCDPPYEPMPGKSGFTNYSGQSFRFDAQARLAQSLKAAHQRGASVVITNSGAPSITELYTSLGFKVMPLRARRSISCAGDTRETVTDIIGVLA